MWIFFVQYVFIIQVLNVQYYCAFIELPQDFILYCVFAPIKNNFTLTDTVFLPIDLLDQSLTVIQN